MEKFSSHNTFETPQSNVEMNKRGSKEEKVLSSESFEDVAVALEEIKALQNFRSSLSSLPFGSFFHVFEDITRINKEEVSLEEKEQRKQEILERMGEAAQRFSPRVADIYTAIVAELQGNTYEPLFPITGKKMDDLRHRGDLLDLVEGTISWDIKLNRIQTSLMTHLLTMRDRDKKEGNEMDDDLVKWRQEEILRMSIAIPPLQNSSKPSVDPMERAKSNEKPEPIWAIQPGWGGYYKEQSFSKWDAATNRWLKDIGLRHEDVMAHPLSGESDISMTGKVRGGSWVPLSIPYTHDFHEVIAHGRTCHVKKDQNGDVVMMIEGQVLEEIEVKVTLAASAEKKFTSPHDSPSAVPDMPSEFSEETQMILQKIKQEKQGTIPRAEAIRKYVVSRVRYLAPKTHEEAMQYNTFYDTHPKGFAGAVDEVKKGDCDVVNTYFAALCARLHIPVRHVVGHSVKGQDAKGVSSINFGTGHGWSEVWNETEKYWQRFDATPPGDPNLDEDTGGPSDRAVRGDYGIQEAVRPTDEELEKLHIQLAEYKEKLSYTKEERHLAESAGVELKEARTIVKEINEAEKTRLPNGELLVDVLSRLFNAIVESRKATVSSYDGPLRKSEGGEGITNIVRHVIGVKAGDMDPASRERVIDETKEEKILGGFDFYLIADKSGSMSSSAKGSKGEELWKMQRRAAYLTLSSLNRFERNIERAHLQKENALSVRTQSISFRGDNPAEDIDVDKPLSGTFSPEDKVRMWHSLTEQGGGNGDVAALSYVYLQIREEIEKEKKINNNKQRLRIVVACSDGGPDNAQKVQQCAKDLGELGAVVVGIGLTKTAATIPIIFNTPHSRGEIVADINDLPAVIGKHIVLEAIKLFPEKGREDAKRIIEKSIAKFDVIK